MSMYVNKVMTKLISKQVSGKERESALVSGLVTEYVCE